MAAVRRAACRLRSYVREAFVLPRGLRDLGDDCGLPRDRLHDDDRCQAGVLDRNTIHLYQIAIQAPSHVLATVRGL